MDGGAVTRESFKAWWTVFSKDELGTLLQREDEAFDVLSGRVRVPEDASGGHSKHTGKQLFEQHKVNSTSDLTFLGDTAADEAVFEMGPSLEDEGDAAERQDGADCFDA